MKFMKNFVRFSLFSGVARFLGPVFEQATFRNDQSAIGNRQSAIGNLRDVE